MRTSTIRLVESYQVFFPPAHFGTFFQRYNQPSTARFSWAPKTYFRREHWRADERTSERRVRKGKWSASTLKKEGKEAMVTSRVPLLILLFLPLLPSKTASATKSWSYSSRNRRDEKLTSRRHLIIYLRQRDRGCNWLDFLSMQSRWSPRDGADEETWLYRLLHTGAARRLGRSEGSAIRVRFPFSLWLRYLLRDFTIHCFYSHLQNLIPRYTATLPLPRTRRLESVFA